MIKKLLGSLIATIILAPSLALAGPYAPAAGTSGSTAIQMNDSSIQAWATGVTDYTPGTNLDVQWTDTSQALGQAEGTSGDIVSLGRGGSITLTFDNPIFDGEGYDFAIFENSFSNTFLELAWVDVSTDGFNFFRIPGFSLTPDPVGSFGAMDATNIDGLAGKYSQGFGTPFDLGIFGGVAGIDINNINFIRLTDIIGDGSEFDYFPSTVTIDGVVYNTGGPNPIYDPTPTFGSAGFDLDAIGVIHTTVVPIPASIWLFISGLITLTIVRKKKTSK